MPGFFYYMNYILFDTEVRFALLPFTHTRPVADIRCGIHTMRTRWEALLAGSTSTLTETYLQELFPFTINADNIFINGAVFATEALVSTIQQLPQETKLVSGEDVIAFRTNKHNISFDKLEETTNQLKPEAYLPAVKLLRYKWDIFSLNEQAIKDDFPIVIKNRKSAAIPEGVTVVGKENLFIEASAKIQPGTVINASGGAVYIGNDAEIMEGCLVRGPLALCDHAVLKMGTKVYTGCTIGPGCKVGGEISNVVFFANSNKGHDGFVGNAVIGEWCNLGADTNSSNLKNNYDQVKIWDEHTNRSVSTGLTFCGLLMGDHSKCGINTMFNTGTVVGVSCNIYGGSFPEKFIPSFAWGGSEGAVTYRLDRAMDTARRMMARRNLELDEATLKMYDHIFQQTQKQRAFILGDA